MSIERDCRVNRMVEAGAVIRAARKDKGLTLLQAAEATGLDIRTLWEVENQIGRIARLSVRNLVRIIEVYDIHSLPFDCVMIRQIDANGDEIVFID